MLEGKDMGRADSEWEARRTEYETLLADIRERASKYVQRTKPWPRPNADGQLPPEAAASNRDAAPPPAGTSRG